MKAEETKALATFTKEILRIDKADTGGAYLRDLVEHADHIAQNIKDDFPWENGLYVAEATHANTLTAKGATIAILQMKLKEAKEFDVRVIKAREAELAQSIADQTDELQTIRTKLKQ